jgi:TetR/AcrR family transcriptional regulator, cholesterol catabolism regulator
VSGLAALRPLVRRGPGRPPGPSQAADVRARIVAEASRLYAAGGYAGLSVGTLAARVGITKATVFHYFATKDALAVAVFDALGERLEGRVHEWLDAPGASYAMRLERLLHGLVQFYGADPINAQLVCHGLLEVELVTSASRQSLSVFATFVRELARFLEAGIAAGEFHPARALGTIVSIGGVVLFECMLPAAARRRYGGRGVTLDDRAREVVTFVRRAVVRPPRRRAR